MICMDCLVRSENELALARSTGNTTAWAVSPCHHVFHTTCLQPWMAVSYFVCFSQGGWRRHSPRFSKRYTCFSFFSFPLDSNGLSAMQRAATALLKNRILPSLSFGFVSILELYSNNMCTLLQYDRYIRQRALLFKNILVAVENISVKRLNDANRADALSQLRHRAPLTLRG